MSPECLQRDGALLALRPRGTAAAPAPSTCLMPFPSSREFTAAPGGVPDQTLAEVPSAADISQALPAPLCCSSCSAALCHLLRVHPWQQRCVTPAPCGFYLPFIQPTFSGCFSWYNILEMWLCPCSGLGLIIVFVAPLWLCPISLTGSTVVSPHPCAQPGDLI